MRLLPTTWTLPTLLQAISTDAPGLAGPGPSSCALSAWPHSHAAAHRAAPMACLVPRVATPSLIHLHCAPAHLPCAAPAAGPAAWARQGAQLGSMRSFATKQVIDYVPIPEPKRDSYADTEPKNYVQLLHALTRAPTLGRLTELVTSHSGRFDAVHVAAALTRLPRVIRYRPSDMLTTGEASEHRPSVMAPVGGRPSLCLAPLGPVP